ncbi:MAG: hypothetical protein QOE56_1960, partial [Solirubrobacterales bacterium]|nr:hypothetical protein [Solirubrobacterales bacterium]
MRNLRSKLTYANVMVSILAFCVLGGGTAFAAMQVAGNSVGTKQLKKGAVTPGKLSSAAKDTMTGATGPEGLKGDTGAKGSPGVQGDPGVKGEQGETGPSDVYSARLTLKAITPGFGYQTVVSVALPAGNYLVS